MMKLQTLIERRVPAAKWRGIAAALLPYDTRGAIAVEEFQRHLLATHRAGLMNAVNMDTGYVNYLSDAEQHEVLRWTRAALGNNVPFVAGAYIEGRDGEVVALYRRQMDLIVKFGGIPILFQTARLHGKSDHDKVRRHIAPHAAATERARSRVGTDVRAQWRDLQRADVARPDGNSRA